MKELSIEEKAKRYNELKVKASQIYNKENDVLIMHTIEDLFPELAESENEKIRKSITEFFKNYSKNGTWKAISDVTKWIAWLEKQGEQKPAEWSEEDEKYYDTIIAILENTKDDAQLSDSQISFLKSLRSQNIK